MLSPEQDAQARFEEEQLRAYQMTRLRYYYAIITCDTAATGVWSLVMCHNVAHILFPLSLFNFSWHHLRPVRRHRV